MAHLPGRLSGAQPQPQPGLTSRSKVQVPGGGSSSSLGGNGSPALARSLASSSVGPQTVRAVPEVDEG